MIDGLIDPKRRIAVAVSGGSDSLALLHRVHAASLNVIAVTVDHGLRDTAASEIAMVADQCTALHVPHHVIALNHLNDGSNLQARARAARYTALSDWAQAQGITQIAIGHTQDDQAETFMLRLARGSGLDGLSAMAASWDQNGVTFLRPVLGRSRQDLRDWLTGKGLTWADDPSNADPRFDRVKMRQALAVLDIDPARIADAAHHLKDAKAVVDDAVKDAFQRAGRIIDGNVMLNLEILSTARDTVIHRLIARLVQWIGNSDYPPRFDDLRRALADGGKRTLHGVIWETNDHHLRLSREYAAVQGVTTGQWDGRWRFTNATDTQTTRALGPDGLKQCPDWRASGYKHAQLWAAPSLWGGNQLIAAPHAHFGPCDHLHLTLPQGITDSDVEVP
ncbi:MAG: tRNA lysidine(34) synthetase TilS [Planktomarina sp.]